MGVARIGAATRKDAMYLTGYAMAADRIFQMDLSRRRAAGRLAEICGPDVLASDRRAHTIGYYRTATMAAEHLPKDHQNLLQSFADGVNAYLNSGQLDNRFPFNDLVYTPEAWTPVDTLSLQVLFCDFLTNEIESKRCRTILKSELPEDLYDALTSEFDVFTSPLIGPKDPPVTFPEDPWQHLGTRPYERPEQDTFIPGFPLTVPGSNAWTATDPSNSVPPLLANDLHLGLTLPSPLLPISWHYGTTSAAGFAIPGLPYFLCGATSKIAWGLTNFCADTLDLVAMSLSEDGKTCQTASGPRPLREVTKTIHVRGSDPVNHTHTESVWGPVLDEPLAGKAVACRWTALDPAHVDAGWLDVETAQNAEQALEICQKAGGPPVHFHVADTDGHTGWGVTGRIPIREGEDHLTCLDGASKPPGPAKTLPTDMLPRAFDPPSGHLISANHRMVARSKDLQLGQNFGSGFRFHRISHVLDREEGHELPVSLALQHDTDPGFFDFYAQMAAGALEATPTCEGPKGDILSALRQMLSRDSIEPGLSIAAGMRDTLLNELLSTLIGPDVLRHPGMVWSWRNVEAPLRALLADRARISFPFTAAFEGWEAYIADVTLEASRKAPMRHAADVQSEFAGLVPGWSASDLSLPGEEHLGTRYSVCVGAGRAGAVARVLTRPGGPLHFQMPGGVSEDPNNPHYRSTHELWRTGRPAQLPLTTDVDS